MSKGKMIGIIVGSVVAIVVVVIILLLLLTAPPPEEPFTIQMTDTETMSVSFEGELKGENAKMLRAEIEDECGLGDGNVISAEVSCYIMLQSWGIADQFQIDSDSGMSLGMNLDLDGATGNVNSGSPIKVTFSGTVEFSFIDTDKTSYFIYVNPGPMTGKDFKFISPPGYEIANIIGLDSETLSADHRTVTGKIGATDIYINTVKIGTAVTGDSEPNDDFASANLVSDGDTVLGSLDNMDDRDDYFFIFLQDGDTIEITLTGPIGEDFDLRLYDSGENTVDSSFGSGSNEFISYSVTSTDVYYINVLVFSGSGDYSLDVDVT